ncbi:MAG: hypothetical protein KBB32_09125 [Spirochaetia bacterium]|nr:hypothetical protein [Spirochaetia bacterium]
MKARALSLAAASCGLVLASCNLFMPVAQSPLPRQPDGMVLLSHSSISMDGDLENVRIKAATLDGASPPDAYIFISADDRYFDGFLHYSVPNSSVSWVSRNGISFEEDTVFSEGGIQGFYAREGENLKNITDNIGSANEVNSQLVSDATVTPSNFPAIAAGWDDTLPTATGTAWAFVGSNGGDILTWIHSGPIGNVTPLASSVTNGLDVVGDSFQVLTGTDFWNSGRVDIRKAGRSADGLYSWFVAERHDDVRGIHENRLVSVPDSASVLHTSDHTPQGTAGSWLVASDEDSNGASRQFILLDAALTERHAFKLYGTDVRYLGETVNTPFGPTVPASVFVVLSALRRPGSGDPVLHFSLWACPTAELDQL